MVILCILWLNYVSNLIKIYVSTATYTVPTSHEQERNLRMLFFQRGESSTGGEEASPEQPEMLLTIPQGHCKHCHPSLINKPRAKSLTRVPGAVRSSSGTVLCSSNKRHKNPLQFGMIHQHLCEPGFPQPDLLGSWSAKQGDKSWHQ